MTRDEKVYNPFYSHPSPSVLIWGGGGGGGSGQVQGRERIIYLTSLGAQDSDSSATLSHLVSNLESAYALWTFCIRESA